MSLLILVVDDEADVEVLFRQPSKLTSAGPCASPPMFLTEWAPVQPRS